MNSLQNISILFFESYYKNYEHYIEEFFIEDNAEIIFIGFNRCYKSLESKTEEINSMMKKLYLLRNDAMLDSFNCSQPNIYKTYEIYWINGLKDKKIFDKKEWNELIDHIVTHKNIKMKPKLMR